MTVYLHFPDNSAGLAELKSVSQNQPQGCYMFLLRSDLRARCRSRQGRKRGAVSG
jgi:hypothetical protein